jgi:serine/threonine protein kinase
MAADASRLRDLFLAAAELPVADRSAFLMEGCGSDAELRAAVEKLLAAHADPNKLLKLADEPADRAVAAPLPTTDAHSVQPDIGTVLVGRYTLLEEIAEGGMGTVWLARQAEPVKRMVAIKLIKPGMDSKVVLARFEAERQALALMDHPNIARVLDAGVTRDGRPFFVMDLVKGVPITLFCDARKLTVRERLELFLPVCQAIQHAHQKGIIHRDIKPSNVLVALYDDRPVPKVIDFGVAKAIGQPLTEQTFHTGFGTVIGTPQYMSPEQATFNNLDIDTRSDLYSLGVLLYELLVGTPPFAKQELEMAGILEMLRVVREVDPPRPSTKLSTAEALPALAANRSTEPGKLTGMLQNELDWIVLKALEKDRIRRYSSANSFAEDVQRYLAGEAVQAVPPSGWYRLKKTLRRNRGPVVAAALVLLVLVVGIIGTTIGLIRAKEAKEAEAQQRRQVEQERDEKILALKEADEQRRRAEYQTASVGIDLDMEGQPETRIELLRLARRLPTIPEHSPELRDFVIRRMLVLGQHFRPRTFDISHTEQHMLSHDGQFLVRYMSNIGILYECRTGKEIAIWRGTPKCFDTTGKKILVLSYDGSIQICDTSGRRLTTIPRPLIQPNEVKLSPDGKLILAISSYYDSETADVKLWDAQTGKLVATLPLHKIAPTKIDEGLEDGYELVEGAFSTDGTVIWTVSLGQLRIWSASDGRLIRELGQFAEGVNEVLFSPEGRHLSVISGKKLYRWSTGNWIAGEPTQIPVEWAWSESRWFNDETNGIVGGSDVEGAARDYTNCTSIVRGRTIFFSDVQQVEGNLALGGLRAVFDLRTGKRLPNAHNKRVPSEIITFAINKRFLIYKGMIYDLLVDKPVSSYEKASVRDSYNAMIRLECDGIQGIISIPLDSLPSQDIVVAWAKIMARGELDQNEEFVAWDERKWEALRQSLLGAIPKSYDYIFDKDIGDPLLWLRQEIEETEQVEKRLQLLDRLVRNEPSVCNYLNRAQHRNACKKEYLAIQDVLEASRLAGVFINPNWDAGSNRPSWNMALQPGWPREHYELALRWEQTRRTEGLDDGLQTIASIVYRLGKYNESLSYLRDDEAKEFLAPICRSLLAGATTMTSPLHFYGASSQTDNQLPAFQDKSLPALRALCYHKLGQPERAKLYLGAAAAEQALEDMKPDSSSDPNVPLRQEVPFYREAVEVITGIPLPPRKKGI